MITLAEYVRRTEFFTIAHRGASGIAPENTIAAMQLAIKHGAAMVEFDVQTSADNNIVVFHDDDLQRTTNGTGALYSHTYDQLRKLDAGSWFDTAFKGEKIPLLHEVLAVVSGKAFINVEIKPRDQNPDASWLIGQLIQEFELRNLLPYSLFSSFDHELLLEIREVSNATHTCALNVPGDTRTPSEILRACKAQAFGCSIHEMQAEIAHNCKEHGIPWGVYTVNSLEELAHARSLGVKAVVTNEPHTLAADHQL